ncbi:MAG: hypothetical protein MZV64_17590 [Ignavibacteriales bacterium]|nr:hypothetical protein [Ignavibacteriales bacterium]
MSGFIQRVEDTLIILSIVEPDHHVSDPMNCRLCSIKIQSLLEVVRTDHHRHGHCKRLTAITVSSPI